MNFLQKARKSVVSIRRPIHDGESKNNIFDDSILFEGKTYKYQTIITKNLDYTEYEIFAADNLRCFWLETSKESVAILRDIAKFKERVRPDPVLKFGKIMTCIAINLLKKFEPHVDTLTR